MGERTTMDRLRSWLAQRCFALAGRLDKTYDVWLDEAPRRSCEICERDDVPLAYHGWHDDGDPMLTCETCAP